MIEFRAERPVWGVSLNLYAKQEIDGKVYAVTCHGLRVDPVEPTTFWPQFVSLPLQEDAGQSLFDALWSVGYRTNKGEASTAHVEALKYHLEDMRKLVFDENRKS